MEATKSIKFISEDGNIKDLEMLDDNTIRDIALKLDVTDVNKLCKHHVNLIEFYVITKIFGD